MSPLPEVVIGNHEPLYNIGVVSRMTGVSMATLRAWERRYDFPESERTAGGHRLYSEKDVLRLRWVKGRIDDGMQTAQAINALRHQELTGHLTQVPLAYPGSEEVQRPAGSHLKMYQHQLLEAILNRDIPAADILLGDALAISAIDDLILDVIGPTISQTGDLWERGEINISVEHFATNYLRQKLLMWMLSGPAPRNTTPIVLACAPNEWHEGSLLILGALLRRRRWPVVYLGQSLPLADLADFVGDLRPAMLVLVAMTEHTALELLEWPDWLPDAARSGRPVVGYGGRIFVNQPEWRLKMPGVYLGDDFRTAIDSIEKLI